MGVNKTLESGELDSGLVPTIHIFTASESVGSPGNHVGRETNIFINQSQKNTK